MPDINVERKDLEPAGPATTRETGWGPAAPARGGWPFGDLSRHVARNPFDLISQFRAEMDRAFSGFWREPSGEPGWSPAIEVFERDGKLVIHADLPGVDKDDVRVHASGDTLTIEGQRNWEHQDRQPQYHRSERSYGVFCRTISLPQGARVDEASARFDHGVLEVLVPIPESRPGREIPIQTVPAEHT